jgi:hypothetical protein
MKIQWQVTLNQALILDRLEKGVPVVWEEQRL